MSKDAMIPFNYFFCGGFGGICSVIIGHPFDTIKVRLQCMAVPKPGESPVYQGSLDCAKKIIQQHGAKGLYVGMATPLFIVTPVYALSFYGYWLGKNILQKYSDQKLVSSELFLAGAFSGFLSTILVVPSERVKCLLQVQQRNQSAHKYYGPVDCFRQLFKEGGIVNLYRGTSATLLRDVSGNGVYFLTYEWLQATQMQADQERLQTTMLQTIISGGLAGILSWMIALPFDILKTRLQTASKGTYSRGIRSVYLELIKKEGLKAMYKGSIPTFIRAFSANAACFVGFEESMKFINWALTKI